MTGDATLHLHCRVLIHEGPSLLHVALHTGLKVGLIHAGDVHCAVRGVAIGTLDHTFGNPVMDGQGELRLNRGMAGET